MQYVAIGLLGGARGSLCSLSPEQKLIKHNYMLARIETLSGTIKLNYYGKHACACRNINLKSSDSSLIEASAVTISASFESTSRTCSWNLWTLVNTNVGGVLRVMRWTFKFCPAGKPSLWTVTDFRLGSVGAKSKCRPNRHNFFVSKRFENGHLCFSFQNYLEDDDSSWAASALTKGARCAL